MALNRELASLCRQVRYLLPMRHSLSVLGLIALSDYIDSSDFRARTPNTAPPERIRNRSLLHSKPSRFLLSRALLLSTPNLP